MTSDVNYRDTLKLNYPEGSTQYRLADRLIQVGHEFSKTLGHGVSFLCATKGPLDVEQWVPKNCEEKSVFDDNIVEWLNEYVSDDEKRRDVDLARYVTPEGIIVRERVPLSHTVLAFQKKYGIRDMSYFVGGEERVAPGSRTMSAVCGAEEYGDAAFVVVFGESHISRTGEFIPGRTEVYRDMNRIIGGPGYRWDLVDRAEALRAADDHSADYVAPETMQSPAPNNVIPLFPAVAEEQPPLEDQVRSYIA